MLPYDTGISCIASVHSFGEKKTVQKSGIDESTEGSTIPACPTGSVPKGLILRNFVFYVLYVCFVLYKFI